MERATYPWSEIIPHGSIEGTSIAVAADSIQRTMTIKTNWNFVPQVIAHIIGYSVVGAPGQTNFSRITPAKHPGLPWLRATKIISIQGRLGSYQYTFGNAQIPASASQAYDGFVPQRPTIRSYANPQIPPIPIAGVDRLNQQLQGQAGVSCGAYGIYGYWDQCFITILFEAPKYPILEDNQIQAEYQRYTLKKYDTNIESLARKGERWQWASGVVNAVLPSGFPGDLLLKQAKGILSWTWMDVPEQFLMLGRLIPTNLLRATGKVNLYAFPKFAHVNQNAPTNADGTSNYVQFPAGTLLMLPIKTEPRSQVNPHVLETNLGALMPHFFPRTYDVMFTMVHFDPQPNGELPPVNSGFMGGNTQFTSFNSGYNYPPTAPAVTGLIQGHNLVPTPIALPAPGLPSRPRFRWWAAFRNPPAPAVLPTAVTFPNIAEENLLYSYTDFEQPFGPAV